MWTYSKFPCWWRPQSCYRQRQCQHFEYWHLFHVKYFDAIQSSSSKHERCLEEYEVNHYKFIFLPNLKFESSFCQAVCASSVSILSWKLNTSFLNICFGLRNPLESINLNLSYNVDGTKSMSKIFNYFKVCRNFEIFQSQLTLE